MTQAIDEVQQRPSSHHSRRAGGRTNSEPGGSILIPLLLLLGCAAVGAAPMAGTLEQQAITRMSMQGIIQGLPDGTIRRGEFAVSLQRLFSLPPPATPASIPDVLPSSPFYSAVQATAPYSARQILCFGCSLGKKFFPDAPVSRAEQTIEVIRLLVATGKVRLPSEADAAAIVARVKDADTLSAHSAPYFAAALQIGVLSLAADGVIDPSGPATHATAATLLDSVQRVYKIQALGSHQ